jgi:hypothetical protein
VSTIRARVFVLAGKTRRLPAIVTLHQTVPQEKDEPAGLKPTLPWLAFATYYAERGYATLAPDMIGSVERTAGVTGVVDIHTPSDGLATLTFNTPTSGDNQVCFVNTPPGVVTSLLGGSDEDTTNVRGSLLGRSRADRAGPQDPAWHGPQAPLRPGALRPHQQRLTTSSGSPAAIPRPAPL